MNVETQDENRLVEQFRQNLGAEFQNQGLPGTRHTVNDAMPVAEATGQLFLMDVHHLDDIRDGNLSGRLLPREKLQVVDPDFRVQVPADAVQVGQGQRLFESVLEHAPKAFLEFFRLGVLQHLVLADQQATWQHPFGFVIPAPQTGSACG